MAIVRHAARELTGADGATFVLRDGDLCHYADEDAIAPLWKGRRFPISTCISGWAMLNRQAAVIEDIYADPRIPAEAYRPTFVKSLAMVPIRTVDPVGAIGNYWATRRQPRLEEVKLLQALADSTSVAMENVQLYAGLERKVADRTARLQTLNEELEAFSYSVSHDLRAPLRHIDAYTQILREEAADMLNAASQRHLAVINDAARRMGALIDDLLEFSRMGRSELKRGRVNMEQLVEEVRGETERETKDRAISWSIGNLPEVKGDRALLKQVWVNLLSNAVKYSRHGAQAEIRIGATARDGETEFFVQDNGAGFDMEFADKLFGVFQRLHASDEFEGTGIGLANVRRIVGRHGGRTWAEGEVDRGATFFFTLPATDKG
jgi:signal transduction histidine kinase